MLRRNEICVNEAYSSWIKLNILSPYLYIFFYLQRSTPKTVISKCQFGVNDLMDIPQDIIDNVIAAIGDDQSLLKNCALVSSSFLHPSRKQLFSRISLRSHQTCQGIYQFLIQNPAIQSFVKSISINRGDTSCDFVWMNSTSLLAILRLPFCQSRLESFSIIVEWNDWDPWDWHSFSSEMKDAILNIIHSSTLKTLSLTAITKMPITIFLDIVHLTTLELRSLSPDDFDGGNSSLLTQAASKGVAPVIDRCVWHDWRLKEEHVDTEYEIPFHLLISD